MDSWKQWPLLLGLGAAPIWLLAIWLGTKKSKSVARGLSLVGSLIFMGAAIWGLVNNAGGVGKLIWQVPWFPLSVNDDIAWLTRINFEIGREQMIFWMVLAFTATLGGLHQIFSKDRVYFSVPVIIFGGYVTIISASLLTFFLGAFATYLGNLMALAETSYTSREKMRPTYRYAMINGFGLAVLALSVLGFSSSVGSTDFGKIAQAATRNSSPEAFQWSVILASIAAVIFAAQFPFMQLGRFVSAVGGEFVLITMTGVVLVPSLLVLKMFEPLSQNEWIPWFAAIPLLTSLAAVIFIPALTGDKTDVKKSFSLVFPLLAQMVVADVFLAAFFRDRVALTSLVLFGSWTLLTFSFVALTTFKYTPVRRALLYFVVTAVIGLPLSVYGWSLQNLLVSMLAEGELYWATRCALTLWFIVQFVKTLSMLAWTKGFQADEVAEFSKTSNPTVATTICFFLVVTLVSLDYFADTAWFLRIFSLQDAVPKVSDIAEVSAPYFLTLSHLGMLLVGLAVAYFGFMREVAAPGRFLRFKDKWSSLAAKVAPDFFRKPFYESWSWDTITVKLNRVFAKSFSAIDEKGINNLLVFSWQAGLVRLHDFFDWVDTRILDRGVVEGLGRAVETMGKALRLVHLGQAQFYLMAGLFLAMALVLRYLI